MMRPWFPKPYADAVQRLRVASGFLLLVTFAVFSKPTWHSIALGLPVCVVGLVIRAWAAGHLAKNEQLAASGPYAWVRNPLYVGTLLTALGLVIGSQSPALWVIFTVVFVLVYLPVIELEEQHLRDIFPNYGEYAAKVNRLVPVRRWTLNDKRFSWSLYQRNKEQKALLGFLVAFAWLAFRAWRG